MGRNQPRKGAWDCLEETRHRGSRAGWWDILGTNLSHVAICAAMNTAIISIWHVYVWILFHLQRLIKAQFPTWWKRPNVVEPTSREFNGLVWVGRPTMENTHSNLFAVIGYLTSPHHTPPGSAVSISSCSFLIPPHPTRFGRSSLFLPLPHPTTPHQVRPSFGTFS